MNQPVKHVLFICTGNSARGLIAEALLTVKSQGLFRGHSAGVHPGGLINPFAAELIQQTGYPMERLRCKRWEEFIGAQATRVDFVVSLCEQVRQLPQPEWPGNPIIAAWDIEDPTSTTGSIEEKREVFKRVCRQIEDHIDLFLMLPHQSFDREVLRQELNDFHLLCEQKEAPPEAPSSAYAIACGKAVLRSKHPAGLFSSSPGCPDRMMTNITSRPRND